MPSVTLSSTPSTSPSRSIDGRSPPNKAVVAVLDQLIAANGALFGVDLTDIRLESLDTDWSWGRGDVLRAVIGSLVALLSGRTLPDGRALQRVER